MRLEFIHPIYLPSLTEAFLRKDFNFAAYLGFAYGKTLQSFFNTSWVSLLFVMIFAESYKLLYYEEKDYWWGAVINMCIPVIFLFVFLTYYYKFNTIQKVLYPQIIESDGTVLKPEEIHFHIYYDSIDPPALLSTFP